MLLPRPGSTMHCDRCNVDFPEGLRYCKWCGESLIDRPRITSELHSCPSCSAAIQPGWTFCKLCGERLHSVAREAGACAACGAETEAGAPTCLRCGENLTGGSAGKIAPDPADTSVFAACSACGERLDTGSLYCKGCGSAVYTEKPPFGGSALLCGACNSYSPLGSRVCRVCGAPLVQGFRTVVDFPAGATTTIQQRAPTLPDLDQQILGGSPLATPEQEPTIESGANTLTFSGAEPQTGTPLPRSAGDTNMLPGTAGARSEQQAPTAVMHMGRITGPVDADEVPETLNTSGGLANPSATDVQPPANYGQQVVAGEPTVEFAAGSRPPGPTTLGLGSESESESDPASSESKTAIFVSPSHAAPPPSREQLPPDDIGTKPFTPVQPTLAQEPTREFERPAGRVTGDHVEPAGQMKRAPQRTSAEPIAPTSTAEQSEVQTSPVGQGASQPLPKRRTGVVIASVVVVLILLGASGYVGWLLFGRARPAPPVPPPVVVVTPAPPNPEKPPAPVVPVGMVAVSVGTYTIGRDGADPLEQPEHKVNLPSFFIDRSEVTNAAYKNFVDATHHKAPSNWSGTSFPEGRADFPVTGVTWQDAVDYATWAGKRLPTEVEWEAAARGADGRLYPWGNDWRLGLANTGLKPDKPTPEQYPTGIREAGRYPQGASPAGAVDMIGNAWEWVADEINVYPGNTESKLDLESGVTYRVIRGGAYDGSKVNDATYRGYLDGSQPYPKVGFRCAKDAK
jgi:formylglycine-generating enzyme required for sulfatase activity